MTIGATEGKEPDYIGNGDVKSLDELRGAMVDMHKAKLSLNEKATVQGVRAEVEALKCSMANQQEQMRTLISIYQTLQNQFTDLELARVRELGAMVGGGSTTPEDYNGSDSQPSN